MWIIKSVIFSALVLILQTGCVPGFEGIKNKPTTENKPTSESKPSPQKTKVGIGIERGDPTEYPEEAKGTYYYGQVVINPQLTSEALQGPEAQTFLDHISNLLGNKKTNFGLSATPTLDGQVQPAIVLFNYSYDSATKSWKTYLNEEARTRMVLLKPNTTLSFELKYTSIDTKDFNKILDLSKQITSVPVLVSGTSIPYLDLLADHISNILSSSVTSSTVLSFTPVANNKKSVEYIIKSGEDKELAKVKFSLLLRNSVVSGKVVDDDLNEIPIVSTNSNPLNFVFINYDNKFTLNDQLGKDESMETFSQINAPVQFRTKCQSVIDKLETYGLNLFDRYTSLYLILEKTDFLRKENLFNSGCLSSSNLKLLKQMGIPISAPTSSRQKIEISSDHLKNFGGYMLNPVANIGFKSDLLKLFSETIIVQKNDLIDLDTLFSEEEDSHMTPTQFMDKIGKIGVARFGSFSNQKKEYVSFLFRPLKSNVIYRIKLNRERSWGKIRTVLIKEEKDNAIIPEKLKQLRTYADKSVRGYEKDIMRLSSKSALQSNN